MLLSLDWLSSLVDLDGLDTREIADLLTLATAEVEQIEEVHLKAEGIVAEVVYDGGTLVLSDGSTTLPGSAPDALAVGARVVVLRDGKLAAPLTGGPGPWLLGADVAVGQDVEDLVPASDTLFELDNKSLTHRPDLWGHYGFARELAAIFERELVDLEEIDLSAYADLPSLPVQIESPDCFYYSAIAMRCAAADPSPLLVQRRLAVLDQRSLGLSPVISLSHAVRTLPV